MVLHRAPDDWREILRRGRSLATAGRGEGLEILLAGFRWRYDTARSAAVRGVASLRPPPVPRLLRMLASSETAVERRAAADALGLTGGRRVVPALVRALRDPNMVVRRAAMTSLLRLRATEAVPAIAKLLRDPSGGVRVLAADILGRFRDPSAVPALVAATRDPKWYVRLAAVRALGEVRDPRAAPALRKAAEDPRPAVSNAAKRALSSLQRQTPTRRP